MEAEVTEVVAVETATATATATAVVPGPQKSIAAKREADRGTVEGGGSSKEKSFYEEWLKSYYKEATGIDLSKQALNFSTDEWFAADQKMELQALLASVCKFGISKSKSNDYSTLSGLMDIFSSAANANANAEQTIDIGGLRKLDALFVLMNESNKSISLWLDIIKKKREAAIKVSISEAEPAELGEVSTFLKLTCQLAKSLKADALVVGIDGKVSLVKEGKTISISAFMLRKMVKEQDGVDVKMLDVFDVIAPVVSIEELVQLRLEAEPTSTVGADAGAAERPPIEVLHGFAERPVEFWQVLAAIIEKLEGVGFVKQNPDGALLFLDESQEVVDCEISHEDFLEVLASQPTVLMLNWEIGHWLGVKNLKIAKPAGALAYASDADADADADADVDGGGGGAAAGESALNVSALVTRVNKLVAVEGYVFGEPWSVWHEQSNLKNEVALHSAQIVLAMLTGMVPKVSSGSINLLKHGSASKKGEIDDRLVNYLAGAVFGEGTCHSLFSNVLTMDAMLASIPVELDLSEERLAIQERLQEQQGKEVDGLKVTVASQTEEIAVLKAGLAELRSQQEGAMVRLEEDKHTQQAAKITELETTVAELKGQVAHICQVATAVMGAVQAEPGADAPDQPGGCRII